MGTFSEILGGSFLVFVLSSRLGLCVPLPVVTAACTLLPCSPSSPSSQPAAGFLTLHGSSTSHPKKDFRNGGKAYGLESGLC